MNLAELLSGYRNLEAVLDSMADTIIAHDAERRITFFNRAAERLTGLMRDDVLGKDCHEILAGGFCGSRCAFCDQCIPEFELMTFPLVITDTAGEAHRVEITLVPMRDSSGEVTGAVAAARDLTELTELRRRLQRENSFQGIVGQHHRMQAVYELIRQAAPTDVPVLIQGESGTGKELVAGAIHSESERGAGPFVAVNCGALPEGLLESELFGHVKGAFTGAVRDKRGRFERADGGTLFLDEVAELTPVMQVKLLRVLQDRRFERVGGESPLTADVRVISATNQDLRRRVRKGRFREDLFFRLCVVPIELPPLRSRGTDVFLLADHLLERLAEESGCRTPPALSENAARRLLDHSWPGNVRELENSLRYALVKTPGGVIRSEHLPPSIAEAGREPGRKRAGRKRKLTPGQVRQALERARGNKAEAARLLGVGRSTLYRYVREAGHAGPAVGREGDV